MTTQSVVTTMSIPTDTLLLHFRNQIAHRHECIVSLIAFFIVDFDDTTVLFKM